MRGPSVSALDVERVVRLLAIEPLTRKELVAAMQDERPGIGDSAVRIAIENARSQGEPIIHDGERYRLASNFDELESWIAQELDPRLTTLSHQRAAMRARAEATWTDQMRLISA